MFTLIKKDFNVLTIMAYLMMTIIIFLLAIITLPAMFITAVSIFALVLSLFTYDERNKTNRFIASLPVTRKQMVESRYAYAAIITGAVILVQCLIQQIYTALLPGFPHVYGGLDYVLFFCLTIVLLAVFLPILYFFKQQSIAIAVILLLFIIGTYFTIDALVNILGMTDEIIFNDLDRGFLLLAEEYLPFAPLLLSGVGAIALFFLSMHLSVLIFKRKDLS